jgi:hypothetical protein
MDFDAPGVAGLLRGTFANMAMGPKANKLPYVFTNPHRDSEVWLHRRTVTTVLVEV